MQVNNENVVKVGHRQVVNMIRQGGNHLVLKVVTVTRNLDPDDTARKKGTFFSLPNGPSCSSFMENQVWALNGCFLNSDILDFASQI